MKVLSLTQPWATLMVTGHKLIETRSWPTYTRGTIGIHAAKGFPMSAKDLMLADPFWPVFMRMYGEQLDPWDQAQFPLGAVLGTVDMYDCQPTERILPTIKGTYEEAFGNYEAGRFGFLCRNPVKFDYPIPAKGALSFWVWDGLPASDAPTFDLKREAVLDL